MKAAGGPGAAIAPQCRQLVTTQGHALRHRLRRVQLHSHHFPQRLWAIDQWVAAARLGRLIRGEDFDGEAARPVVTRNAEEICPIRHRRPHLPSHGRPLPWSSVEHHPPSSVAAVLEPSPIPLVLGIAGINRCWDAFHQCTTLLEMASTDVAMNLLCTRCTIASASSKCILLLESALEHLKPKHQNRP
jgi:hypothetical protein